MDQFLDDKNKAYQIMSSLRWLKITEAKT
jgi:hypothetical protein